MGQRQARAGGRSSLECPLARSVVPQALKLPGSFECWLALGFDSGASCTNEPASGFDPLGPGASMP